MTVSQSGRLILQKLSRLLRKAVVRGKLCSEDIRCWFIHHYVRGTAHKGSSRRFIVELTIHKGQQLAGR